MHNARFDPFFFLLTHYYMTILSRGDKTVIIDALKNIDHFFDRR